MRNDLKRVLAIVLTVLMLLMLLPAGLATGTKEVYSGTEVPGLSDGGTLLNSVMSATPPAVTHTVTFNIGQDALNAAVEVPSPMTVAAGTAVGNLPVVSWKDAEGNAIKIFSGWYTDEACTKEFTKDDKVKADMTVYAKWVGLNEEGRYYVNFYSYDGQTVYLTVSAETGRTVNPAQGPERKTKIFRGWSETKQGDLPLSDLPKYKFDFNTAISSAVKQGENTLNLYAWYGDEVSVNFVANGGIAVPTRFLAKGESLREVMGKDISKLTPTRTGYTFKGWSTDSKMNNNFALTTPIMENMTLYAFWKADLVTVTLVYMHEHADDSGYSPAGFSRTVYAPAGSYLSIEPVKVTDTKAQHKIRYAADAQGSLIGDAATAKDGSGKAVLPDIHDTYFQYHTATNNRYVMPDGSGVMLVYYNRAKITLTFKYTLGKSWGNKDKFNVNKYISAADQTKYAVKYTEKRLEKGFTYSFTAKYGQSITAVWPRIEWITYKKGGDKEFYTWLCPDEGLQSTNMYTLETSLFKPKDGTGVKIQNGELVGNGTLTSQGKKVHGLWAIYARTTLPGETADFTYANKSYTIYKEACQKMNTPSGLRYKALAGCKSISGDIEWNTKYENLKESNSISADGEKVTVSPSCTLGPTMKNVFDKTFVDVDGKNPIVGSDDVQVLLYDRETITLTLHVNDDTYKKTPQTQNYLYGDWIYNDDADLLKVTEASMKKEGQRFAGWYMDPDFTDGTQYVPDGNSRINGDMELYAKWEPNQFRAEYYLFRDDAKPYREQGFAEGEKIKDWSVPVDVQSSFEGWYWYQDGRLVPFDFSAPVGKNHVDENGVVKLYAKWKGTTGKVSYLPGIGGDNSTQEVFDSRDFAINEASVQLKQPQDVWKDSKPSVPADKKLTFVGWKAPNGAIYQPGRYVLVTRALMQFEAQWSSDAVTLTYKANGGVGSDVVEHWARNSNAPIWDNDNGGTPHFTREGYELLGWSENAGDTVPQYKLGEGTINLPEDKVLYAIWKPLERNVVITKKVTGNMGDRTQAFNFTVTSDKPLAAGEGYTLSSDGKTASFVLSHEHSVTLNKVPMGAQLTIAEEKIEGYDTTMSIGGTAISNPYTIPADGTTPIEITVFNERNGYPDTGIILDSLPYILILICVIGIGVVAILRKRRRRDDDD